jgi:hypothetical protein
MEVNLSGPTFNNIIRLVDEIVETTKNKQTQIEKLILRSNFSQMMYYSKGFGSWEKCQMLIVDQ